MNPLRLVVTLLLILCVAAAEGRSTASVTPSINRERIEFDGTDEPHTPPRLNRLAVFRYFLPDGPEPSAVLLLIPGLNSGVNTLDLLARALVTSSRGAVQVWIMEPRGTLLQDRRGVQAALADRDPDLALAYYYGKFPIAGHTFQMLPLNAAPYAAYWGLDMQLRDIRVVVLEVRKYYPRTPVFLGGHSLGAILGALYAGYDFNRNPGPWPVRELRGVPVPSAGAGARDIRGLVMLDGAPLSLIPRISPDQYLHGVLVPGLLRIPGVEQLTASDPRRRIGAFTDTSNVARTQDSILFDVIALYAYLRPEEPSRLPFYPRNSLAITNEALLGGVLSDQMQRDVLIRASVGAPLGDFRRISDPADVNPDGLLDLQSGQPAPGEKLIRWIRYDRSAPPGRVDLRALEEAILRSGGDFTQWYVPWRLILDLGLAAALDTSDAFSRQFMSLTQVRHTSLPILIIGAGRGLIRRAEMAGFYLGKIATPPSRVKVEIFQGYTHLDMEDATDNAAVPLILGWIESVGH